MSCPANNVSIFESHVDNGNSSGFVNPTTSAFLLTYLIVFGSRELWMYRKHGTPHSSNNLPKSKLYLLQQLVTYIPCLLAIIRFFVQLNYVHNGQDYGFLIMAAVVPIIMFPFSAYLIKVERHYSTVPRRGHRVTLLLFWAFLLISDSMAFVHIRRGDAWFQKNTTTAKIESVLFITQYSCSWLIFVLGLLAPGIVTSHHYSSNINEDNETNLETQKTDAASVWHNVKKKLKMLAPLLWPQNSWNLQFRAIVCLIIVLSERLIHVLVPYYSKLVVDSMTGEKLTFPWDYMVILAGIEFLKGGLDKVRWLLWNTVQQNTTREVKVKLFRHLHGLSLRWHLSRETGEVLQLMDRGANSVGSLLDWLVFDIIPTLLDIIFALGYFVTGFGHWFGFLVLAIMALHVVSSIFLTEWRTKYQKSTIEADDDTESRSVDSLLNFETVKYYGAEDYEVNRYNEALSYYQNQHRTGSVAYHFMDSIQEITIGAGLLGGSLLCAYEVVEKKSLTVGDYVLFTAYLAQLHGPLTWLSSSYRYLQESFLNMDKMLNLLAEEPEVKDLPSATTLAVKNGGIEFRNVAFSYVPERPILKNISFKVEPGKTIAIVGPSGSGKTTIIRLLFRFYDVNSGFISIDGQNIQTVTQKSLRKAIGVVPQDTVLFNDTIRYNIQYGRPDASESEIINAAKIADIHERILTFPKEYDNLVGERGLKLSGGEKQRVAIARTLLKSPNIVLLDEATSSLDTMSERNIQAALNKVCQNKTTIIIAHRLSTIIHADEILVLKDGEICERGRHKKLIKSGGLYATMWKQQLENDQSTDEPTLSTEETNEKL